MKFNTIRFKITWLHVTVLGGILGIYAGILSLSFRRDLYRNFDTILVTKAEKISNTVDAYLGVLGADHEAFVSSLERIADLEIRYDRQEGIAQLERLRLKDFFTLGLTGDYINFLDARGEPLVQSSNVDPMLLRLFTQDIEKAVKGQTVIKNIAFGQLDLRVITASFPYGNGGRYIIQVGSSLRPLFALMTLRLYHRLIPIPLILLVGFFLGGTFAGRIVEPMEKIAKTARRITYEDLSARVKVDHADEEIKNLAAAFNDMIIRLEKSFRDILEFSTAVSHELKTPIAIIRGELELALNKGQSAEEYKRVLRVGLDELSRMLRTIDDLLLLTKLDYRPEIFKFRRLDLAAFLMEIYEQTKLLAAAKNITVNIDLAEPSMAVNADRLHLQRLFFNLIHNAVKFNPRGGAIRISAQRKNKDIVVSVSDTGIGITETDLPKIFDKFFYVDRTNQKNESGNGLGLSIAQSVVKIHHGTIEVKSRFGEGATFIVTLPSL